MEFEEFNYSWYKELEEECCKSSNWYRSQMLSELSNSDIAEIITDKHSEKLIITKEKADWIKDYRGDWRKILEMFYNEEIFDIDKLINWLKFILKNRDPNSKWDEDLMKKLEQAKANVDIVSLIEYMVWKKITTLRNNKCFLPDHKDKTGSCKVYKNTNSWYCWGCHRWWDIVSFVEHYIWCTRLEAIKKIINFNE